MEIIKPSIKIEKYNNIKIMQNIEKAMRNCYRSEDSMTEDSYKRLLAKSINSGHLSVMEHEKITVRIQTDISFYKDITRHRFASFSIESTRYCNYSKDKYSNNIKFLEPPFYKSSWLQSNYEGKIMDLDELKSMKWYETMKEIEDNYLEMAKMGCTPDELRMILPHSTAATVVMTCNIREWRHIFELRCSKFAHSSCRQILIPLLLEFKKDMPELFEDIDYDKDFPIDKYASIEDLD